MAQKPEWFTDNFRWPRSWRGSPEPNEAYDGQDKEDEYAYHTFFKGLYSGTYLELGALDGVRYSNTRWFHKQLGWRGLLIEANPDNWVNLIVNRPHDICVHTAICKQIGKVHWAPGPSCCSGIFEFMSSEFINKWHPEKQLEDLTEISCVPLSDIFTTYHIRHIDFFSLDVEGGELEVLESIDFKCVNFNVIVIEADGTNPAREAKIQEYLKERGYDLFKHVERNNWFVRKSWWANNPLNGKASE